MKKPKPPKDLYAELGVDKNASKQQIKQSYRKRVKHTHPDVKGSTEQFLSLQLAYDVLSDDRLRTKYDQTGSYDTAGRSEEIELFVAEFINAIESDPSCALDVVRQRLDRAAVDLVSHLKKMADSKIKIEKVLPLYRRVSEGDNIIACVLQQKLSVIDSTIAAVKERLALISRAKLVADQYEFTGKSSDRAFDEAWMTRVSHY